MHRISSNEIPEALPLFEFEEQFISHDPIAYAEPLESIDHSELSSEGGKLYNVLPNIGLAKILSNQVGEISCSPLLIYESILTPQSFQEFSYNSFEHIEFSSKFESGNLSSVHSVERNYSIPSRFSFLFPTNFEYDLLLRPDIHSKGNTQWYYFKASNKSVNKFPITIRFNIINLRKQKSLYSYGCKPVIYSCKSQQWCHQGNDICYYKNKSHYTLTFTYTFDCLDDIYIASCYPYTYSHLQKYLFTLQKDENRSKFLRRKLLCNTLYQNRCELLIISAPSSPQNYESNNKKPVVVICGRVHPGESNSSYVIEGLIDFLTSDCREAKYLLALYTFRIVPMLNPDGVINGNYRASLAGTDLNRRYLDAHEELHPTITAFKRLLNRLHYTRGVSLFLDIHGHSAKKNTLIYGCDAGLEEKGRENLCKPHETIQFQAQRLFSRLFPKVLSLVSNHFSYHDCNYRVQLSKRGTGRVTSWRSLGIPASYTVEVSLCGNNSFFINLLINENRKWR